MRVGIMTMPKTNIGWVFPKSIFVVQQTQIYSQNELFQVLEELAVGIYGYNQIPFLSMHFNTDSGIYTILHPCYQKTLIGEIFGKLDYYMKGILNGLTYKEDFIQQWENNPIYDEQYLKRQVVSIEQYCSGHNIQYESMRQQLDLYQISKNLSNDSVKDGQTTISFRIIAKQSDFRYSFGYFDLLPDFDIKYTIDAAPALKENQDVLKNLELVCLEAAKTIKIVLPQLPWCQKYLQLLGVINYFAHHFLTLKAQGLKPIFPKYIEKAAHLPMQFPYLPIQGYKLTKIKLQLADVILKLNYSEKKQLDLVIIKSCNCEELQDNFKRNKVLQIKVKEIIISKLQGIIKEDDFSYDNFLELLDLLRQNCHSLSQQKNEINKALVSNQEQLSDLNGNKRELQRSKQAALQEIRNKKNEQLESQGKEIDRQLQQVKSQLKYGQTIDFRKEGEMRRKFKNDLETQYSNIEREINREVDQKMSKLDSYIKEVNEKIELINDYNQSINCPTSQNQDELNKFGHITYQGPTSEYILSSNQSENQFRLIGGCGMKLKQKNVVYEIDQQRLQDIVQRQNRGIFNDGQSVCFELAHEPQQTYIEIKDKQEDGQKNQNYEEKRLSLIQAIVSDEDNLQYAYEQCLQSPILTKNDLFEAFSILAKSNNVETTYKLIECVGQYDAMLLSDSQGSNLLHFVAQYNSFEWLSVFQDRLQQIRNRKNNFGATELYIACQFGSKECLSKIIEYSQVNQRTVTDCFPLETAVHHQYIDCVKLLCSNTSLLMSQTLQDGTSALHRAIELSNLEIVKVLASDQRCNVNQIRKKDGLTPLNLAAKINESDIIEYLMSLERVDKNLKVEFSGDLALHIAARKGHQNCIKILVRSRETYIKVKNKKEQNALIISILYSQINVFKELIKQNAFKLLSFEEIKKCTFLAANLQNWEMVNELVEQLQEQICDIFQCYDQKGETICHYASRCIQGQRWITYYLEKQLIDKKIDQSRVKSLFIAQHTSARSTPYHEAAKLGIIQIHPVFQNINMRNSSHNWISKNPLAYGILCHNNDVISYQLKQYQHEELTLSQQALGELSLVEWSIYFNNFVSLIKILQIIKGINLISSQEEDLLKIIAENKWHYELANVDTDTSVIVAIKKYGSQKIMDYFEGILNEEEKFFEAIAENTENIDILINAIEQENQERIDKLLHVRSQKINLNQISSTGKLALNIAIESNNIQLTTLLLQKGANPNFYDKQRKSSIFYAINYCVQKFNTFCNENDKNYQVIDKLFEYGIYFHLPQVDYQFSVLHEVVKLGMKNLTKYLISKGCELTFQDYRQNMALHLMIKDKKWHKIVRAQIRNQGKEVLQQLNKDKQSILSLALENDQQEMAKLIMEKCDLKWINQNKIDYTQLIETDNEEMSQALQIVSKGKSDIFQAVQPYFFSNLKDQRPKALQTAVRHSQQYASSALASQMDYIDKFQGFSLAISLDNQNITNVFFNQGFDFNTTFNGTHPLSQAAFQGNIQLVDHIICFEDSPTLAILMSDQQNINALVCAIAQKQIGILQRFVNILTEKWSSILGDTLAHLAVRYDSIKSLYFFIFQGASFSLKNKLGLFPLDEALKTNKPKTAQLLLLIGAPSCINIDQMHENTRKIYLELTDNQQIDYIQNKYSKAASLKQYDTIYLLRYLDNKNYPEQQNDIQTLIEDYDLQQLQQKFKDDPLIMTALNFKLPKLTYEPNNSIALEILEQKQEDSVEIENFIQRPINQKCKLWKKYCTAEDHKDGWKNIAPHQENYSFYKDVSKRKHINWARKKKSTVQVKKEALEAFAYINQNHHTQIVKIYNQCVNINQKVSYIESHLMLCVILKESDAQLIKTFEKLFEWLVPLEKLEYLQKWMDIVNYAQQTYQEWLIQLYNLKMGNDYHIDNWVGLFIDQSQQVLQLLIQYKLIMPDPGECFELQSDFNTYLERILLALSKAEDKELQIYFLKYLPQKEEIEKLFNENQIVAIPQLQDISYKNFLDKRDINIKALNQLILIDNEILKSQFISYSDKIFFNEWILDHVQNQDQLENVKQLIQSWVHCSTIYPENWNLIGHQILISNKTINEVLEQLSLFDESTKITLLKFQVQQMISDQTISLQDLLQYLKITILNNHDIQIDGEARAQRFYQPDPTTHLYPLEYTNYPNLFEDYQTIINYEQYLIKYTKKHQRTIIMQLKERALQQLLEKEDQLKLLAGIRISIKNYFGIYLHDTQVMVVLCLLFAKRNKNIKGAVAQVLTGEGKSAIICMKSIFHALCGNKIDIMTTTTELAARDVKKFQPFYKIYDITCKLNDYDKQEMDWINAQIVYGTNYSFEFAYLREKVQPLLTPDFTKPLIRDANIVLIDELDHLFIDQVLDHAIIGDNIDDIQSQKQIYNVIFDIVSQDPNKQNQDAHILEIRRRLQELNIELDLTEIQMLVESVYDALLKKKENVDYIIQTKFVDGISGMVEEISVVIVDNQNTGRLKPTSRWENGIHEFLELKHNLIMKQESKQIAQISHPVFFSFYDTIYGLTGTIGDTGDRQLIEDVYRIMNFDAPPHKINQRKAIQSTIAKPDIYLDNLAQQVVYQSQTQQRPCIIFFQDIQQTINCSDYIKEQYPQIKFQVIDGKQTEEEEEKCMEMAGQEKSVTISTLVFGRGIDIILSQEALYQGGLHIFLTFHPNERAYRQCIGRAARQGQPGSFQFALCHELIQNPLEMLTIMKEQKIQDAQIFALDQMDQSNLAVIDYQLQQRFWELFMHWKQNQNKRIIQTKGDDLNSLMKQMVDKWKDFFSVTLTTIKFKIKRDKVLYKVTVYSEEAQLAFENFAAASKLCLNKQIFD